MPSGGSFFGLGKAEQIGTAELQAGRGYELEVRLRRPPSDNGLSGLNIGAFAPVLTDPVAEAVDLAADADLAIVVVGTNADWESEGYDRDNLDLPGRQDELIANVARAGAQTIVSSTPARRCRCHGSTTSMLSSSPGSPDRRWVTHWSTCWSATSSRRDGCRCRSRASLEDTPAFEHHPGRNGVANYLEGRLIGYRWYDTVGREPLFPFGFGLGYADVAITAARLGGDASQPSSIEVDLDQRQRP